MPRTPQGEPAFNARDAAVAKDIDQRFMDVEANPAALNYTLHQALVTAATCRRLFSLACVSLTRMPLPQITGLTPGQTYYYRVGSSADHLPVDVRGGVETGRAGGWSDIISFDAFPPAV